MVSRLILNLRTQALRPSALDSYTSSLYLQERFAKPHNILTSTIIGNLGQPIGSEWLDDETEADFYNIKKKATPAPAAAYKYNDRHARTIGATYELEETNYSGMSKDWSTLSHSYAFPHHTGSHAPSSASVMAPEIRVEVTRAVTVEGPDGDVEMFAVEDEDEQPPSRASSSFAHVIPTSSESGHVELESRSEDEDRRSGAWQPPSSWMLEEGVDVSQLGKPRRSNSR